MRDLAALQSTSAGRLFLESEGVFDDPEVFLRHLPTGRHPVYVHQQVYLDYRASVVAKIILLRSLAARSPAVDADFVWIDTDRAGSDKLSLRLYLQGGKGRVAVRVAPPGAEDLEPRFVDLDPVRVADALRRIEGLIIAMPDGRRRLERFVALRPAFASQGTLADLSRSVTDALFAATMSFAPRPRLVSSLVDDGALTAPLQRILERQADFVAVFNERVEALRARDVDPAVKLLAPDYLPLFIAGPAGSRRLRLHLVRDGGAARAVAVDRDGMRHGYELAGGGVAALENSRVRWSPDVTLPILLNQRYGGMIAGKSSALYMLVFNHVMRKVLEMEPVPVLVPSANAFDPLAGGFDSLFEAYLAGRRL